MQSFHIDINPPKSTHQNQLKIYRSPRTGKAIIGKATKGNGAVAEATLKRVLKQHRPAKPHTGALALTVRWSYPYRKSEPKKNRLRAIPCDTRPDCDNLMKKLGDVMTKLEFWKDDAQIAEVTFRKEWSDSPGITITISRAT